MLLSYNCYNPVFNTPYPTLRKGKLFVITKDRNNQSKKASRINKIRRIFLILIGIDLSQSNGHFPLLSA